MRKIFSLVILDLSKTVVDLTDEPTQSSQSEATKTSQRWEDKEILMFLSCYAIIQYVHEVGAAQKPNLSSEGLKRPLEENVSSASTYKKTKSRINTGETSNRLTELEAERNDRDQEFLETWKSQSESNSAKNNAIIAASQAIGQVSLAIPERLKRQDTASSAVNTFYNASMKFI